MNQQKMWGCHAFHHLKSGFLNKQWIRLHQEFGGSSAECLILSHHVGLIYPSLWHFFGGKMMINDPDIISGFQRLRQPHINMYNMYINVYMYI